MFCMARIVCHLKFEAIATQSTLVYPAPIQGSLCQEFVEGNNIKMPRTFVRGTELS